MIDYFSKYSFLYTSGFTQLFIIGFVAAFIITLIVRKFAVYLNIVDIPNKRKVHTKPIPLLGGVAIFAGFALTLTLFGANNPIGYHYIKIEYIAIFFAALFIHIVGIIDDIKHLSAKSKLFCQIIAAIIVIAGGTHTDLFIHIRWINYIITIFWIVAITNSFNLLDNMDGLSCGITAICSLIFFVIFINQGQYELSALSLALTAATLGFLPFNYSPASIFMGDGGSLLLGFIISVISIKGVYTHHSLLTKLPVMIPLLILFIPIYDTLSVIFIRLKLKISIFTADKRHFSHRLVNLGIKPRYAVLIIYMATISTGITAALLTKLQLIDAIIILIHTIMVFGIIAILEWFGFKKNENDL